MKCICPKWLQKEEQKYGYIHLAPIDCVASEEEAQKALKQIKDKKMVIEHNQLQSLNK